MALLVFCFVVVPCLIPSPLWRPRPSLAESGHLNTVTAEGNQSLDQMSSNNTRGRFTTPLSQLRIRGNRTWRGPSISVRRSSDARNAGTTLFAGLEIVKNRVIHELRRS